jgi:hypothetical protein
VIVAFVPAAGVAISTLIAVVKVEAPTNAYVGAAKTRSLCRVKAPVAHWRVAAVKFAPIDSVLAVRAVSAGVVRVKYEVAPDVRAMGVKVLTALIVNPVVEPLTADPRLIVVVEPLTPAVPKLMVLVVALSVAPEPTFSV